LLCVSPSCLGEGKQQYCNQIQSVQFSTLPGRGQCPSRTTGPCQTVYPGGDRLASGSSYKASLAGRLARLEPHWTRPRQGRAHECSRPDGFWRYRGPARAARIPIITRAPGGRGYSIGHFLGQLCLFRQPRPGPAFRPQNPPPAWPAPVSACQHGL
jgi:hypothetical protein